MKAIALAFLGLALALSTRGLHAAILTQMEDCGPRLPKPQVHVQVLPTNPAVKVVPGRQLAESFSQRTHQTVNGAVAGVTAASLQVAVEVGSEHIDLPGDGLCMAPMVSIVMGFSPMNIFVSRELARDSCAYDYVVKHEMKHVLLNNEVLLKAAATLQEELREKFSAEPVIYTSHKSLQYEFRKIRETVADRTGALFNQANVAHRKIDTPASRAESLTVCNGILPLLLGSD
ncbi:hypothetical protein [Lacisediminimonas profundi]|uniref:hypothetical protein n=1 Tax=Lacisediminimonas profundi TaxID=2603856 RepID=UPI00124B52B9|nr:hypothetical protein [Lacisediminimonas profundi]